MKIQVVALNWGALAGEEVRDITTFDGPTAFKDAIAYFNKIAEEYWDIKSVKPSLTSMKGMGRPELRMVAKVDVR